VAGNLIVAGCDVMAVDRIIARVRARDDGPGIWWPLAMLVSGSIVQPCDEAAEQAGERRSTARVAIVHGLREGAAPEPADLVAQCAARSGAHEQRAPAVGLVRPAAH
jgi:hypothetical protein